MDDKLSTLVALGLLACSTWALSAPPVTPASATPAAPPPLVFRTYGMQYVQPLPKAPAGLPLPRTCLLGRDCLTMDSHPFEVCQVSSKNCGDKLAEVLQVEKPGIAPTPVPIQKTSTRR
jgi:hypothetical protein